MDCANAQRRCACSVTHAPCCLVALHSPYSSLTHHVSIATYTRHHFSLSPSYLLSCFSFSSLFNPLLFESGCLSASIASAPRTSLSMPLLLLSAFVFSTPHACVSVSIYSSGSPVCADPRYPKSATGRTSVSCTTWGEVGVSHQEKISLIGEAAILHRSTLIALMICESIDV